MTAVEGVSVNSALHFNAIVAKNVLKNLTIIKYFF